MAAGAFLELLEWLREVLLQDAVFLRESYPDHPIFQDPVFSCPEFEAFASKVQDTCTRDHEDSHTTVIQKRSRWLRRSCAHWMSLRRPPTPSPSAPAKVLQVNMRRSRELINRGAALHERRSSEQQQGMVQAGQGKPQGRAHGEPPGPREPPSFKLPVLSNLYRSCCVSGGRAGAKCLLWILLSETGVLDGGHLQRRITFPRARSSSMRFGGGPSRTA
ncbi:centromere DNA-binding protein complex CBF3 subunit, domain 2 domain-containing protein [Hirsutella rhossiliensis]